MKSKIFYGVSIINMIMFSFYLYSFTSKDSLNPNKDFSNNIIKVRGLVVVDSLGIERVIVGTHLPEPNFSNGHRIAARGKGGSVSGVMIYDNEGQERGGYVTDDGFGNAFLTLDSKTSQQMLLIAEPQGAAAIQIWARGNNSIKLGVGAENAELTVIKNGKKVKFNEDEAK